MSIAEVEYRMKDPTFARTRGTEMLNFVDQADAYAPGLTYRDRYRTPPPRDGIGPYQGHLTTVFDKQDPKGFNWQFEFECTYNSVKKVWEWNPNRWAGRLATGLTRDDGVGDFRDTYIYVQ